MGVMIGIVFWKLYGSAQQTKEHEDQGTINSEENILKKQFTGSEEAEDKTYKQYQSIR